MKVRPAWAEEALAELSDQLAKLPDLTKGINVRPEGKRTMWQPIETAPKEGEYILLWATSFPCSVVAFWDNSYDRGDGAMLREAKILVPSVTNDGRSTEAARIEVAKRLAQAFGGVHGYEVSGGWRDPKTGQWYEDPCVALVTACDYDSIVFVDNTLYDIACYACLAAEQEAIYLMYPSGEVVFVDKAEVLRNQKVAA